MLLKPSSHMLPMHRSHGRQYCLGYCSDMITEVASNIGHPGLNTAAGLSLRAGGLWFPPPTMNTDLSYFHWKIEPKNSLAV